MKGRKVENLCNKIRLTGCKWSSLNALSTETPASQSLLGDSLFPILSTSSFQSFPLLSARRFAPTRTIGGHRKNILLLAVSAAESRERVGPQKVATDVWVVLVPR